MNFSGFISSYAQNDEEGRKTMSLLLSVMLIIITVSIIIRMIIRLIIDFKLYDQDIILLALIPVFYLLYHLVRRGRYFLVSILFIIISWINMTALSAVGDGIRDIMVLGYLLIIFLAVLLAGYRTAIILTAATIISIWIMAIAEARNILIPDKDQPLVYAKDFTFLMALALIGIMLYQRSLRYSYSRLNRELAERKSAEEKLSQNEMKLMIQNEELLSAKLKAEESDRLKTAFLQNISHEIRTPMNGIVGFAELIKDRDMTNERSMEYMGHMINCSNQLAAIINDLIDISKIEAGVLEMNENDFTSESLVEDIRILFEAAAISKGLKFIIRNDIPDHLIRSDRGKVTRILTNLVDNAIKFTPWGVVTINIRKAESRIVVIISDTGIGIRKGDLENIFDRFRQIETGLSRSFEGSGLGLAICRGNLDFLGGSVVVESEEGKGSVFTVDIPVKFMEGIPVGQANRAALKFSGKIKILIAEDDEISFLYLSKILKNENIEILWARNGNEALSAYSQDPGIDFILMDLKLPVLTGFEVAKRIREQNRTIPIIAVSAYAFEEDRKRADECGINEFVSKPVSKNDLITRINNLIGQV